MYCMNCGKRLGKVGENADVCPFCGARLPGAAPCGGTPGRPRAVPPLAPALGAAAFMGGALRVAGAARLPAASPGAAALFAVFAGIDAAVLRLLLPHQK